ncbi:ATP synthase subunit s-like protein [Dermatophagoides pteronyssinus]|uniref:ATP synthase subunit s-like protein n=1 Tax=Dermatophagoides pteronyssinus TaxID=6956 RepID=A0ABQ8ITM4_DERPT|nr:ATP synthase subunit s-like protein [Dermatophagoides pteronyssinus]
MIRSNYLLSFVLRNYYSSRYLSSKINNKQNSIKDKSTAITIDNEKNDLSTDQKTDDNDMKTEKFDISLIPKQARDNFVIQFNKEIPTYDQLFEYHIDKKLYNIDRIITKSRFFSVDFKVKLQKKYDLSMAEFKHGWRNKIDRIETKQQKYITRRHGILGPDLAAANFILSRGGRVRFRHEPQRWITDVNEIPKTFDKKYRLISIDGSELAIIFEGLDNLILLNELEELNLAGNRLDDWCCDKLARLFRNSQRLNYLNINDNKLITHRGIETLYKIRSLQTLVIRRTKAAEFPFIDLVILMFNDINPNCNIIYK